MKDRSTVHDVITALMLVWPTQEQHNIPANPVAPSVYSNSTQLNHPRRSKWLKRYSVRNLDFTFRDSNYGGVAYQTVNVNQDRILTECGRKQPIRCIN